MKKSIQLLLALSFALPFAACAADDGDDDTGANTDVTNNTEPSTMTTPSTSNDDTAGDTTPADGSSGDETPADTGTVGMACVHTCAADPDCQAVGGTDIGWICTDSSCVPADPCTEDTSCIADLSGWAFTPCTMGGGECALTMQVCVDLGDGTGGCAYPAEGGALDCAALMMGEVDVTNLDDGTTVAVCGQDRAYCNMDAEFNFCSTRCTEDAHCGTTGLVCNTGTGACECTEDAQCSEGTTCVEGACQGSASGCENDEDCTNPFNGGTIACQ